ncbi:Hypothetical predicted protein [Octopus vulgaris]|uniref:Uncharacterized protein n=1 Tax=Octopus vulgaris TaxID=6645 RepID=A0AA36BCC9_OCTVU|nr:Hypothetical predicted protein [Octopus vulgaris]
MRLVASFPKSNSDGKPGQQGQVWNLEFVIAKKEKKNTERNDDVVENIVVEFYIVRNTGKSEKQERKKLQTFVKLS